MISSFLIGFREALEAALIIGIILAFLEKTDNKNLSRHVYLGIAAAIFFSAVFAFLFTKFFGGLEGQAEELFEGITMLIAAVLLTYMIIWMSKQKQVAKELQEKVHAQIEQRDHLGLFTVAFIAVFREGVETVIFLGAAAFSADESVLKGAVLGIFVALIIGFLIFELNKKVDIKTLFNVSSFLLIFFAAGLTAHGVHELQEAGTLNSFTEEAWNTHNLLDEKSVAGGIAKSLFGYNENPSILEAIAYGFYFVFVALLFKNIEKVHRYI